MRCADHFRLHEDRAPTDDAAHDELTDLPPGRTLADKYVYGFGDPSAPDRLIGVIESVRCHPDSSTWYLGLFLIDPARRGDGLGNEILTAFERSVAAHGFGRIRLAVVDANEAGRRFWERHGYRLSATREGHELGSVTHRVHVLDKVLPASDG